MRTDAPLEAADVIDGFQLVLRRPPESAQVVQHYVGLGLTASALLAILMDSDEFQERQRRILARADLGLDPAPLVWPGGAPRVLLFGAYGNGNVGDMAQAAALAALLRRILSGQPTFAATSWERQAAFSLPGMAVLRPDAVMRPEHLRPRQGGQDGGGADLLVIGGGGLLGAPHFPLHDRRWVEWLQTRGVPYVLLGVGGSAGALAEPGWCEAYQLLLAGAAFVGVRDAETLAAAGVMQPGARWFPDPIFAEALLAPEVTQQAERRVDALLIPRVPNGPADQAALDGMLAFAARAQAEGCRVMIAALEPGVDREALAGAEVTYITEWAVLMRLCRDARFVFSARLHGVIAGLAAGCAVYGLAQPKTRDLMGRLGLDDWFVPEGWRANWTDPGPDLSEAAAQCFAEAAAPGLATYRSATDAAIAEAGTAMGATLRRSGRSETS